MMAKFTPHVELCLKLFQRELEKERVLEWNKEGPLKTRLHKYRLKGFYVWLSLTINLANFLILLD